MMPDPGTVCAGQSVGFKASASLRMAEAALSLTVQTEEFFASSWGQYEDVDAVDKQIVVMGEAPGSVWADVTWSYGGQPRERFCYQLVEGTEGYQVAVLTPMA